MVCRLSSILLSEYIMNKITLDNTLFISDPHFSHKRIYNEFSRAEHFSTVDEMDDVMIENWNDSVPDNTYNVFCLGDFCFGSKKQIRRIRERLNGNIVLIKGNHDRESNEFYSSIFNSVHDIYELKQNMLPSGIPSIVLCHYAMRVWNKSHYGSWHLYGHSHGSLPDNPRSLSFDCGVDALVAEKMRRYNTDNLSSHEKSFILGSPHKIYRPISLGAIADRMSTKTVTSSFREYVAHQ